MITVANCFNRNCKFYRGILQPDGDESQEKHYCHAFPEGIPNDIISGVDLHLEVRDDQDNDIVFEKE